MRGLRVVAAIPPRRLRQHALVIGMADLGFGERNALPVVSSENFREHRMSSPTPNASVYACESSRTIGSWSISAGKRTFDAMIAGTALIFVLPFMAVIGILVKITSTGPVLFRQQRVGQRGRAFTLLKFRSMAVNSDKSSKLTCSGDPRVTPVGKFLRKTKLDELPQLYNVVRGDMSLVGPRPDMPEYIATLSPSLSEALLLRPGITSVASIEFADEEAILAQVPPDQLHSFYTETLLPRKIALDLEYARSSTFVKDLKVIARTVGVMF